VEMKSTRSRCVIIIINLNAEGSQGKEDVGRMRLEN
jgi:hypothetical protein